MLNEIVSALAETCKIILIVGPLMILVEYLELRFKDQIRQVVTEKAANQYVIASVLGAIPGCAAAFFVVSLYVHGLVSFGALTAVMLSTAGDEAFIMLAMIPNEALLILAICIVLGVIGGLLADRIAKAVSLKTSEPCEIEIHEAELTSTHFLREHVFDHIVRRHLPRMFLWIFFALLVVDYLVAEFDLETIISNMSPFALFLVAALVGIVPESGPHLFFLMLYSRGVIPLSVLLVNTLSQDGHGLLPLLSYSVRDTFYVQIFTTLFSLILGITMFLVGL